MHSTSKGMISNYISMIKNFVHVPNGGQNYYVKWSQPPMTTPMMKSYLDAINDTQFVIINKNGKNYTLSVYKDPSTGPRPESYR